MRKIIVFTYKENYLDFDLFSYFTLAFEIYEDLFYEYFFN